MTVFDMCASTLVLLGVYTADRSGAPGCDADQPPSRDALAADGDSLNARVSTSLSDSPGKLRGLQREIEDLQKEAEDVEQLQRKGQGMPTRDPFWRIERYVDLARKAKRAGVEREFLEYLIRSVGQHAPSDLGWRNTRSSVVTGVWTAVALSILEENVGGNEKHFLVPSVGRGFPPGAGEPVGVARVPIWWSKSGRGDEFGTALAAIDSYQDDRARDFLLVYGLDALEDKYGQSSAHTAWALRFLSCYDPKPIKAKLEAAYQVAIEGRPLSVHRIRDRHTRLGGLRSCLTELEFAESLEPGPRNRYQRMLRLLECTYALWPKYTRGGARANPAILFPSWQDGDERFLPHLLETWRDPAAWTLADAPISPKGLAWLKEQAESGNWPAQVKADVTRILRAREGVKEPREREKR